jgi:polysaccharide export outer membrane protein
MKRFTVLLALAVFSSGSVTAQITEYRLGPGDEIMLDVVGEPELTRTVAILPDGTISFPYLKSIKAGGMTPQELDDYMTKALAEYLIEPEVTVTVQRQNSSLVYLFGEVTRPGPMVLSQNMRLVEAIAQAGSFTAERASLREILLLREKEGERVPMTVDLETYFTTGGTAGDLYLKPGDIVYVPTKIDRVYVLGEVFDPGVYEFEEGMTALAAIATANGALDSGALRSVILIRNAESAEPEYRRLNLWNASNKGDLAENPVLKSGDILIVPKRFISKVGVFVRQFFTDSLTPTVEQYKQLYTLRNLKRQTRLLDRSTQTITPSVP